MLFLHVFADYNMQGILAKLKQKENWPAEFHVSPYRKDYKAALLAHAFEWAFICMLPCLIGIFHSCCDLSWANIRLGTMYIMALLYNIIVHYCIDDLKANDKKINLIQDQCIHIMQLVITWACWTINVGW